MPKKVEKDNPGSPIVKRKYRSFIAGFITCLLMSACALQQEHNELSDLPEESQVDSTLTANDTTPEEAIVQAPPRDSLFLNYSRTACFGKCPIYEVKIYHSGYVKYMGDNFVDPLGLHEARIDSTIIQTIQSKAENINFFGLQKVYDHQDVTDLPARIIKIQMKDQKHEVLDRYMAPESLRNLESYLEGIFEGIHWKRIQK